jgi:hypothetical protein
LPIGSEADPICTKKAKVEEPTVKTSVYTHVDSEFRSKFRKAIEDAMKPICAAFGCQIEFGDTKHTDYIYTLPLSVYITGSSEGKGKRPEQVRWESYCSSEKIKLPKNWWKKAINIDGETHWFWDLNPKAKVKHVIVIDKKGRQTPITPDKAKRCMQRQ